MPARLRICRATGTIVPGLEKVACGLLLIASFAAMISHYLRLARCQLGKPIFHHANDARMKLLALVAQQGAIRGVLNQCVLENVAGMGRVAATKYEASL